MSQEVKFHIILLEAQHQSQLEQVLLDLEHQDSLPLLIIILLEQLTEV